MNGRILPTLTLALLLLAPPVLAHGEGGHGAPALRGDQVFPSSSNAAYEFRFQCGDHPPGESDAQALLCPVALFDQEDIMGSPRLALHPKDPKTVAFNALHGGPGLETLFGPPPAAYARNNDVHQPHTTWRSTDPFGVLDGGQLDWLDQPYYSHYAQTNTTEGGLLPCPPACPSRLTSTQRVYGIDNALAVDADARLYEASLYAMRDGSQDPWTYGITVWKQRGIQYDRDHYAGYQNLRPESADNGVDSLHLTVPTRDHVVLLWRETAAGGPLPLGGPTLSSWIAVAYSTTSRDGTWERMPKADVVGPCDAITNAVAWNGHTYIGCVAGDGYSARPDARRGQLDLWRVRVPEARMEFVDTIPVRGEDPRIAIRADGRFAAAATKIENAHKVRLEVSMSDWGRDWSAAKDHGGNFADPAKEIVDARVNALSFHRDTGNLFILYLERYDTETSNPAAAAPLLFNKRLGVVPDANDAVLHVKNLDLGNPSVRKVFPVSVEGLDEAVFEDLHDDMFLWKDRKSGVERIFIAYGDYGLVRYAEVIQLEAILIPGLPLNPAPPLSPVTDPATTQQAAQVAAAVLGGVLASATALRLLLARSKRSVEAPVEGGK
jgi:hypothetical protein